jgi:hypothetical protein
VERSASISENYKYPLGRQPKVLFDRNVTRDEKDLLVGNYFMEDAGVKYSAAPYFFSFNYHVDNQLPVKFEMEEGRILYLDLSVASEPLMYYQMGYALMLPLNKSEDTYQCIFAPDETKIWQKADYQWIWKGPHLYLGFPMILIAMTLLTVTIFYCVHRFSVKKHYHGEDEEHVTAPKRVFLPSYSPTGKYSPMEIIRSLLFASDSDIITQCGTDAYYYLWFQKYTIIYILAMTLVSMPILLPIYFSAEEYAISFKDFAGFTIASVNLRNSSRIYLFYFVIMVFAVFGCIYLIMLRNLARIVVKSNENFGSLYTVMVSNISPKLRNRKNLIADFQHRYGDCVVDAHICYDMRNLSKLDKSKDQYHELVDFYQKMYDNTGVRPQIRTGFLWLTKTDALHHYENLANQVQAKIDQRENSKKINGTGYAFVTFNSIAAAQTCVNDHVVRFCGFSIPLWFLDNRWDYQVQPAPEADDVVYDNLPYTKLNRLIRSVVSNTIMSAIILVVYLVVFCASFMWFYNSTNVSKIWDIISIFGPVAFVLQALVDLTPELISAVTETVKPILEVFTGWEKHHSRFDFRKSVIRKTVSNTNFSINNFLIITLGILHVYFYYYSTLLLYLCEWCLESMVQSKSSIQQLHILFQLYGC